VKRSIPSLYNTYLASRQESTLSGTGARSGLSVRGFWVGSFLSFFLAIGSPYANMAMRASNMSFDFNTPGAIFLFFVLIALINALFKWVARSIGLCVGMAGLAGLAFFAHYLHVGNVDIYKPGFWLAAFLVASLWISVPVVQRGASLALNRAELVLVYVMLMVVSSLCTMGMTQQLLPAITAFFYYATPENKWIEKLLPLRSERVLFDDGQQSEGFYEGGVAEIPYAVWVEPLLWWAIFLLALYAAMVATAVILRRQWMERERLAYPLTQVGLAMVAGEDENRLFNGFLRRPALWCGVAIPLLFGSLTALHRYDPSVPMVNLVWHSGFFGSQQLEYRISFALLGFSYLISTQVAAGIWIFHLLSKIEAEFIALAGIKSSSKFVYGVSDQPLLAYQGGGALLAMVLLGLWVGRGHLKDVFNKALGRAPEVEDGDEIMSYRAAVLCLTGGVLVMIGWLWAMGTTLWVAAVFIALSMLIFIGISRVVAEAGLAAVRSPMIAPDLVIQGIGTQWIGAGSVFNLSMAYIWAADIRIFLMAMLANGLKLIEDMDRRSRRLVFRGVVLAIFIGALGSCWMVMHMAYRYGGINLDGWRFRGGPETIFTNAVRTLEPLGVDWMGMSFLAIGGVVMLLLTWARQYLLWWPLHPIGFPIGANFMMNKAWCSVAIAWLLKKAILRYGGAARYQSSQYFFLGLILGEALCNGLWIVIDYFTGKVGNAIFNLG